MTKPRPTAERLRALFNYDPLSGEFSWKVARGGHAKPGKRAGVLATVGYVYLTIDDVKHLAHRCAWLWMTGEWPASQIDHADLDRTNNAWVNLRLANDSDNRANTRARSHNKLGIKGVSKQGDRYLTGITFRGQRFYIGRFDTAEEASAAFQAKHKELHGEFSR